MLLARVEQEEREALARRKRGWAHTAGTGKGERGKLRARWAYVDECAEEFWARVEQGEGPGTLRGGGEERREAAALLERYARAVAARLAASHPASTAHSLASLSARFFTRASSLLPPPSPSPSPSPSPADLPAPAPDPVASAPLAPLWAHSRPAALAFLDTLLHRGVLPAPGVIRDVVGAHYAERDAALVAALRGSSSPSPSPSSPTDAEAADEAAYAHARSVLDAACARGGGGGGGSGAGAGVLFSTRGDDEEGLDALLVRRLERVERAEALQNDPVLFFVRWIGVTLGAEEARGAVREGEGEGGGAGEQRRDMLRAAMALWEASQARGRSEWEVTSRRNPRSQAARLLEDLVREAVRLEEAAAAAAAAGREGGGGAGGGGNGRPAAASRCLVEATRLATSYLQHHILVHHSTPLLRALTVAAHEPVVALDLFETLSTPPRPRTTTRGGDHPPFTWSAALLQTFTSLFLSAASASSSSSPSAGRDASLPLRLYLSWTSSGLSFPTGLWPALWRSAGRRGSLPELRRLVADWEDTGRGPVSARIMRFVLRGAATDARRVVAPLRILAFFRARYVSRPGAGPSPLVLHSQPYLVVPLEGGYEAVLDSLATSHTDRRRAMHAVWRWMTLDGHAPFSTRAYNALIRANVSRPTGQFSLDDLDRAGLAYNALVRSARTTTTTTRRGGGGGGGGGAPGPDGETFALLVRGFARVAGGGVRLARSRQRRVLALEAALRTFDAACARGLHVPGVETALLVRLLARAGRFEDAKTAQERWWSSVVALEAREGGEGGRARARKGETVWEDKGVERGMREMRWARAEAELIEARWVAEGWERKEADEDDAWEDEREGDDQVADPVPEEDLAPALRGAGPEQH